MIDSEGKRPTEEEAFKKLEPEPSYGDQNLMEAIRLIDEQHLSIDEAASMMGIATTTFRRMLKAARLKFRR